MGLPDQRQRQTNSPRATLTVIPLLIIVIIAAVILVLYFMLRNNTVTVLGFGGDMVKVDTVDNVFWPATSWNVREVFLTGDYYHTVFLYLMPTHKVVTRLNKGLISSKPYYQRNPSRSTGSLTFVYMLPGSSITYLLCLGTENATTSNGTFFVFDDRTKYFAYLNELADGIDESVLHKPITIGTNNNTVCNTIDFGVDEPSYYFFAAETPGDITYFYNVSSRVVYYNQSDYTSERLCAISGDFACNVSLPFGVQGYSLLAYIKATADSDPPTTHVQAVLKLSFQFSVFVMLQLTLILLFIMLVVVGHSWITKPKAQYSPLKTYYIQ